MNNKEKRCLRSAKLYEPQSYGYFPFICVASERIRQMYHETFTCRHFEPCQDDPEEDTENDDNELNNEL